MAEDAGIPRHLSAVSGAGFHAKWRIPMARLVMTTRKAILARCNSLATSTSMLPSGSRTQSVLLKSSLCEHRCGGRRTPVTVLARSGSRSSDIDVVALTEPLPPLNDWWRRAVDVFSNVRSALDQFHHEVWLNQVGSEPGRSIYFPITANEPSWDKWAREHRRFSPEIIERYRAFQPWVSGRPYFETFSEIKRAENHRRSLVPGLDLATLNTG